MQKLSYIKMKTNKKTCIETVVQFEHKIRPTV